jgi:hypothetical protein
MKGSWADQASQAVKQDLSVLLNAALDVVASGFDNELKPNCFLILMNLEGQVTARLQYGHADVEHLVETVFDDQPSLRAVLCVRDPGTGPDPRLAAFGEHREAPAFSCTLRWQRTAGMPPLRVTGCEITLSDWWFFQ